MERDPPESHDDSRMAATVSYGKRLSCQTFLVEQRWPQSFVFSNYAHQEPWTIHRQDRPRIGLHECKQCRRQTSVTVGTVFHRSIVPWPVWFLGHLFGRRADPRSTTGRRIRHGVAVAPKSLAGDGGTEWPIQVERHRRTG